MKWQDSFRLALRSMRQNPVRILLTVLSLSIGIGAIITVFASGISGYGAIRDELLGLGINRIWITPSTQTRLELADARMLEGVNTNMRLETVTYSAQQVSGRYDSVKTVRVVGCTQNWLAMESTTLLEGRFLREADNDNARRVTVIDQTVAYALFGNESVLGRTIDLAGESFTIIGVFDPVKTMRSGSIIGAVCVPVSTMQELMDDQRLDEISVWVEDMADVEYTAQTILSRMERKHGEDRVMVKTLSAQMDAAHQIQRIFVLVMAAVAIVCMLVGGIGVMNIMLASVRERKREIGIIKAIGARSRDICSQFLLEAVLYASASGIVGILMGYLFTNIIARVVNLPGDIPGWVVLTGFMFAAFLGVFFGVYPALRAAKMQVVEALCGND